MKQHNSRAVFIEPSYSAVYVIDEICAKLEFIGSPYLCMCLPIQSGALNSSTHQRSLFVFRPQFIWRVHAQTGVM